MAKRAIKILLALAVTVTMFVVVTVAASAEEYIYVERMDGNHYAYVPGMTADFTCLDGNTTQAQIYFMLHGGNGYEFDDFLFDPVPDQDSIASIRTFPLGSNEDSMENYEYQQDSMTNDWFDLMELVVYSNDSMSFVSGAFHAAYVVYVNELPTSSSSGSSDTGSGGSSGNLPSGSSSGTSGKIICSDGKAFVYDSELLSHCRFGGYPTASYLPVFFVSQNVLYLDAVSEFYKLMGSSLNGYHSASEFTLLDSMDYKIYTISSGEVTSISTYGVDDGLVLSSGTYILTVSFDCGCTPCADYDVSAGRAEFACFVYAVDTLPEVLPSSGSGSGNSSGTYTAGYNTGYSDGYDLGFTKGESFGYNNGYYDCYKDAYSDINNSLDNSYQDGYAEGENVGYNNGIKKGYDIGYEDGRVVGIDLGYDKAASVYEGDGSARYQQGYQDALETFIDTDGDAISGFFTGITGSTINALDYLTKNVRVGSSTLFEIIEFFFFVIFCYLLIKFIIKFFAS